MAQTLFDTTATSKKFGTSPFRLKALVCTFYGALLSAAFPPVGAWFLAAGLTVLFVLVARSTARGAFSLGFWFGVGFFAAHLFWLPNSLSSPNLFGPVAWIIYPPIVLIEGVFWGSVTGLSRLLGRRGAGTLLALPALWLLMEWARTQGPLAFPWGSLGYVWLGTPLAQAADLSGSYGLSLVTLLVAALLAVPFMLTDDRWGSRVLAPLAGAALLLGGTWGYGLFRLDQAPPPPDRQALLVQGNTDPLGRAQGLTTDLDIYTELTAEAFATLAAPLPDLVVWPEGALIGGGVSVEGMAGEQTRLRVQQSAGDAAVIAGASISETTDAGRQYFNTVYALEGGRVTGRYDKVYLVPFGELLPFHQALRPAYDTVYGWFNLAAVTRTAGPAFNPVTTEVAAVAPYICYESVFPQVARSMVAQGAEVLVNISNDAWFGRGGGAEQHFEMGTMRAIETRRYLLRVGNDGVTAVVDPQGRTLQRLERFVPATLVADYALSDVVSPYVRYGDWLIWAVGVYTLPLVGVSVYGRRRSRPLAENNSAANQHEASHEDPEGDRLDDEQDET